jgi:hypothetical protein
VLNAETKEFVDKFSEFLLSAQPPAAPINGAEVGTHLKGISGEHFMSVVNCQGCCSCRRTKVPVLCVIRSASPPRAVSRYFCT